jgi:hypothetical protein
MSTFKKLFGKAKNFAKSVAKSTLAIRISRSLPGLAGMALLALGAAWIWLPAGLIVGGILLLMVDHNM